MAYHIRRNQPLKGSRKHTGLPKYPWHELEIGDEFVVPECNVGSLRVLAYATGKAHGKKFGVYSHGKGAIIQRLPVRTITANDYDDNQPI